MLFFFSFSLFLPHLFTTTRHWTRGATHSLTETQFFQVFAKFYHKEDVVNRWGVQKLCNYTFIRKRDHEKSGTKYRGSSDRFILLSRSIFHFFSGVQVEFYMRTPTKIWYWIPSARQQRIKYSKGFYRYIMLITTCIITGRYYRCIEMHYMHRINLKLYFLGVRKIISLRAYAAPCHLKESTSFCLKCSLYLWK